MLLLLPHVCTRAHIEACTCIAVHRHTFKCIQTHYKSRARGVGRNDWVSLRIGRRFRFDSRDKRDKLEVENL